MVEDGARGYSEVLTLLTLALSGSDRELGDEFTSLDSAALRHTLDAMLRLSVVLLNAFADSNGRAPQEQLQVIAQWLAAD